MHPRVNPRGFAKYNARVAPKTPRTTIRAVVCPSSIFWVECRSTCLLPPKWAEWTHRKCPYRRDPGLGRSRFGSRRGSRRGRSQNESLPDRSNPGSGRAADKRRYSVADGAKFCRWTQPQWREGWMPSSSSAFPTPYENQPNTQQDRRNPKNTRISYPTCRSLREWCDGDCRVSVQYAKAFCQGALPRQAWLALSHPPQQPVEALLLCDALHPGTIRRDAFPSCIWSAFYIHLVHQWPNHLKVLSSVSKISVTSYLDGPLPLRRVLAMVKTFSSFSRNYFLKRNVQQVLLAVLEWILFPNSWKVGTNRTNKGEKEFHR